MLFQASTPALYITFAGQFFTNYYTVVPYSHWLSQRLIFLRQHWFQTHLATMSSRRLDLSPTESSFFLTSNDCLTSINGWWNSYFSIWALSFYHMQRVSASTVVWAARQSIGNGELWPSAEQRILNMEISRFSKLITLAVLTTSKNLVELAPRV